ncbi:MAG: choloylglycine hydrolase [bacterium]
MCTALTLKTTDEKHLFGRTMDLEYNFNQSIIFIPRNYTSINKHTNLECTNKYAILGMGTVFNGFPTFSDVMNEKGLACAGLNFPRHAYYYKEEVMGKINIPVYNFLLHIVSNYSSVKEFKKDVNKIALIDEEIFTNVACATLHFIVTDKTGASIVIEQTKKGLNVYDNSVGVLTNSPTFDYHMMNLSNYTNISYNLSKPITFSKTKITPHGQGNSLLGIPGDISPASRFVRTVILKDGTIKNCKNINVPQYFHIMNSVSMVDGVARIKAGLNNITQYTSCMNIDDGIYYYNTYQNYSIMKIDMHKEDLDGKEIKVFKYNNNFKPIEEN